MNYRFRLASGRVLEFLFTPYLHSPGAIATYDAKTRSLFTSDIFGALSTESWSLLAQGDFLKPMTLWHQTYMSSGRALADCMDRFAALDPMRILPQHGSVLEGDQIRQAMNYLRNLPCGFDLPRG
jgi:flavorubredoxin